MQTFDISGCYLTSLKVISDPRGSVMHFIRSNEACDIKFGEVYFSTVGKDCVKAWKMHTQMTSNLVVPSGKVEFVVYDPRNYSESQGKIQTVELSTANYLRLTLCPGVWLGFRGINSANLIVNFADMIHDPNEVKNLPLDSETIPFDWSERC